MLSFSKMCGEMLGMIISTQFAIRIKKINIEIIIKENLKKNQNQVYYLTRLYNTDPEALTLFFISHIYVYKSKYNLKHFVLFIFYFIYCIFLML